jgi:hypothetical protein
VKHKTISMRFDPVGELLSRETAEYGEAWVTSLLLTKFIERATQGNKYPLISVSAGHIPEMYWWLTFLAETKVGTERICYYTVYGEEWHEVVTICRDGLISLFGRVPKKLSVMTSKEEA